MKFLKPIFSLLFTLIFSITQAQISKDIQILNLQNGNRIDLSGNPSDLVPFNWTSADIGTPNVVFDYSLEFRLSELGYTHMVDYVAKTCCAPYLQDTTLQFTKQLWSNFLNGLYLQRYGRTFQTGDSLVVDYTLNLAAAGPNATYEFRQDGPIRITFYRGQLNNEYKPFNLTQPYQAYLLLIAGNPNTTQTFSWQGTYCPSGCPKPAYVLLIDTVNGNFENPWQSISVPNNDSSFSIAYSVINQAFIDKKTPEGATLELYWTVMAIGNQQVKQAAFVNRLILINGLLDNENHPYELINPSNNSLVSLSGSAFTQLNFKWENTFTPLSNTPRFFLVFDTLGASPIFGNALLQFESGNQGTDTAINLTYGLLDAALTQKYGKGWKQVNLMWGAKAQLSGTFYYQQEPFNIRFNEGILTNIGAQLPEQPLQIFPNPANNIINISGQTPRFNYQIYSSDGKLLQAQKHVQEPQIKINSLAPGLYILMLENDYGAVSTHKLLKQ